MFALVVSFVLLGFTIIGGVFFLSALTLFNSARFHRTGIFQVTPLENIEAAIILFLLVGGFGVGAVSFAVMVFTNGAPVSSERFFYFFCGALLALVAGVGVLVALGNADGRQRTRAQLARDAEARALFERISGDQPLEQPLFIYL
jgi:hypothetical protein